MSIYKLLHVSELGSILKHKKNFEHDGKHFIERK